MTYKPGGGGESRRTISSVEADIRQNKRKKMLDEKLASRYKAILMRCINGIEDIRRKYEIAPKTCKTCSAYDLCEELRQDGKDGE